MAHVALALYLPPALLAGPTVSATVFQQTIAMTLYVAAIPAHSVVVPIAPEHCRQPHIKRALALCHLYPMHILSVTLACSLGHPLLNAKL